MKKKKPLLHNVGESLKKFRKIFCEAIISSNRSILLGGGVFFADDTPLLILLCFNGIFMRGLSG